jgi:uroporphyrinogen III methyltransferase/synthase
LAGSGAIDLVTFTSSSTATNFRQMIGEAAAGLPAAVIGPITADTARQLGFDLIVSADSYTVEGLTHAIVDHFAKA